MHTNRYLASGQVLLVSQACIGGDENLEAFAFSGIEEFTVLELRPTAFVRRRNLMRPQRFAQRNRCALIEQYAHLGRSQSTPRSVFQHGANLVQRHPGEQIDKLTGRDAVFEILEQGGDGHASASE